MGHRPTTAAVALATALAAGCAPAGMPAGITADPVDSRAVPAGGWRELAGSPLAPRQAGAALWTGHEVLIIGGTDQVCPPNALCTVDETPLPDAAAVDPATGRWRRISDPPVPVLDAQGVVVGQTAYLRLSPVDRAVRGELLTYPIGPDRWEWLPTPVADIGEYELAPAGDGLVLFRSSGMATPGGDHLFDPASGRWQALPPGPLDAALYRSAVWTGRGLVLFGYLEEPDSQPDRPSVVSAAALDLSTGRWRRLPDSEILHPRPWLAAGGRLVNPLLGGSDGGDSWGRTYPYGGILDPATGQWSPLPEPPAGQGPAAGAYSATGAVYVGSSGAVLDTTAGTWGVVPADPDGDIAGRSLVAAGTDLLIFGGVDWSADATYGALLASAWVWTPLG